MKFIERLQQRKQDIANKVHTAADHVFKETVQFTSTMVESVKENFIQPIIELDDAVVEHRFNTCKGCDKFNHETQRCTECGCFMQVKTKFTQATCPLNKW